MKSIGLLLIGFVVVSCGGGGSSSGDSFSISFDKSSFDLNIDYNQSIDEYDAEYFVRVPYSGRVPSGEVYVVAAFNEEHIENIYVSVGEERATLRIVPKSELGRGVYEGEISIRVCADAGCNRVLTLDNQYILPYSFDVKYAYLQISTDVGDIEVPRHQRFFSYIPLVVTIPYRVGEPIPPVTVNLESSHNADTIYFRPEIIEEYQIEQVSDQQFIFNPKSPLTRQVFRREYTVAAGRPGRSTTTDFIVIMEPRGTEFDEFSIKPNKIQLNMRSTDSPVRRIYYPTLPYEGEPDIYYEFENTDDQSWVLLGSAPFYNSVPISIDPALLDNGVHEANIFFWSNGAERKTFNIKVSVHPDNPSQTATGPSIQKRCRDGSDERIEGSYRVRQRSEFSWSAVSDVPWIILDDDSGASAGSISHESNINWSYDMDVLRSSLFFDSSNTGFVEVDIVDISGSRKLYLNAGVSTRTGASLYYVYPLVFPSDERAVITVSGHNLRNEILMVGEQQFSFESVFFDEGDAQIDLGFLSSGEHEVTLYDECGFSSGEFVIQILE